MQHLRSLFPRAAFVAVTHPVARLHHVREDHTCDLPVPPRARVVVADAGGDPGWAESQVPVPVAVAVAPSADAAAYWGTRTFTAVVVHPLLTDDWFARADAALALYRCAWCGEVAAGASCPCCGMAGRAVREPAA